MFSAGDKIVVIGFADTVLDLTEFKEAHDKYVFYSVDVTKAKEVSDHCNVEVDPVFKVYQFGVEIHSIDGNDTGSLMLYLVSAEPLEKVRQADYRFVVEKRDEMMDVLKACFFVQNKRNLPVFHVNDKSLESYSTTV